MARWQRTPRLAALRQKRRHGDHPLQDFPRTSESGPGLQRQFDLWLLDYTTMALGHRHPDLMDYFLIGNERGRSRSENDLRRT